MTKEEKLAEEYYYKTYTVTLNIGEEERKKEVTDIFLAGAKLMQKELEEQTQNLAKRICELQSDLAKEKSKNEKITERLEKEKCELLGFIQEKDGAIKRLKEENEQLKQQIEKEKHKKEIETCGGFLKTLDYREAWRLAWDKASKEEHLKMLELPNWDNEVFKEISGIDAEAEITKL
jgi:chromosome segregation ATPase